MKSRFSRADYDAAQAKMAAEQYEFYPDVTDWPAILMKREGTAINRLSGITKSIVSPVASLRLCGFFDRFDQEAAIYAHEHAAELIGKKWVDGILVDNPDSKWTITPSTRAWLHEEIERAFTEGMSPQELAKSIESSGGFAKHAAKMIAHTEIANALIQSHARVAVTGGATHKRSQLSADHDVDDVCSLAAAAGEVPVDFVYSGGLRWPLFHPSCRCTISFYVRKLELIVHSSDCDRVIANREG
jgi:hypothetical protein